MEKNQIIILEDRGLIAVKGIDAKDFLQNILSNDIDKVSSKNSIIAGVFTPQGKYLYEFFVIKSKDGYYLECEHSLIGEITEYLLKYKLRSKIEIKNQTQKYAIGLINYAKFKELQETLNIKNQTLIYRESPIFLDPRSEVLGARILTTIERLYLTIKKLDLKIIHKKSYFEKAHKIGIPIKGIINLKDKLFSLEANLDELNAIDFKKGCYVGQENTARMRLKNKIRRRLLAISSDKKLLNGADITFKGMAIGKVLISEPYAFALIKLFDPNIENFINEELKCDSATIKIFKPLWI